MSSRLFKQNLSANRAYIQATGVETPNDEQMDGRTDVRMLPTIATIARKPIVIINTHESPLDGIDDFSICFKIWLNILYFCRLFGFVAFSMPGVNWIFIHALRLSHMPPVGPSTFIWESATSTVKHIRVIRRCCKQQDNARAHATFTFGLAAKDGLIGSKNDGKICKKIAVV